MTSPAAPLGFFPLAHLGILAIDGSDAVTFLQGQATCDCRQLDATHAALGALCNLQGRMIVSFYVFAVDGGLRLLMPRDRVPVVLTHLKKYAVFSKVSLRDDSDAATLQGCIDDSASATPFSATRDSEDSVTLHLRSQRALRWQAMTKAALTPDTNTAPEARASSTTAGDDAWRAAAIRAGELLVDSANADAFLPQALNYDVIDGVNFRKGCYTGQEVVARMHFKGKMKERLQIFRGNSSAPPAGTPLQDDAGHDVGRVVDAVNDGEGCVIAAVVRHDALARGSILTSGKAALQRLPAPYAIPDSPA